jgi:hypothetical protein
LRLNEDGHFNTLAFRLSNAVAFLPFFSYVWCDNRSSLTRTGDYLNKYSYMYAWGMVDALEVLIKRNCPHLEQYERSILANFYYYKVSLHNSDFKGKFEDTEYDRYVKEFLSMCDINAVVYDNQEEMKETLQDMVNKMFGEGHKPVWDTFLNFLKTYLK